MISLSCGIKISTVHHLVLSESTRVTDRQTNRRTDRRTELQLPRPPSHMLARLKNLQNGYHMPNASRAFITRGWNFDHYTFDRRHTKQAFLKTFDLGFSFFTKQPFKITLKQQFSQQQLVLAGLTPNSTYANIAYARVLVSCNTSPPL